MIFAKIIKDHETGDRHCYAFIEFEDKESCAKSYFKMDNTQVDDISIQAYFIQSVAKLWSQYRPRNKRSNNHFRNGSVDAIKQQKEDN
ncbi:hypothetical protein EJD97_023718 [Solanum chilense]|uniref:peptidylprolyl isomerase n=1 Tax=Solanum chilense TaxID=4083 RepID=A0A6N2CA17_SOLCI|nr:hypothetical protein EJD97_023718 [Solanum chilense]